MSDWWRTLLDREIATVGELPKMEKVSFQRPSLYHSSLKIEPELAAEAWAVVESLWPGARSLPSVISGSGGASRHLYFISETPLRKKTLAKSEGFEEIWDERLQKTVVKHDWMVDLFGTGVQAVLPPSIHPDSRLPYRWERPLDLDMIEFGIGPIIPTSVIETWGVRASVTDELEDEDDLFGVMRAEPMDLTDAQVKDILANIPNSGAGTHYDDYVQVGMAPHHQFRGANEGFERWCEWAKQSSKFDAKNAAVRWRSFKQDSKNPVRMATLMQVAKLAAGAPAKTTASAVPAVRPGHWT